MKVMSGSLRMPVAAAFATITASICLGPVFLIGSWFLPTAFGVLVVGAGCEVARRLSASRSTVPLGGLAALALYLLWRYGNDAGLARHHPDLRIGRRARQAGLVRTRGHQPVRRADRGVPRHRAAHRRRRRTDRAGRRHPGGDLAAGRVGRPAAARALHRADRHRARGRQLGRVRDRRRRVPDPAAGRVPRAGQPLGPTDALQRRAGELAAGRRPEPARTGRPPGGRHRTRARPRRTGCAARPHGVVDRLRQRRLRPRRGRGAGRGLQPDHRPGRQPAAGRRHTGDPVQRQTDVPADGRAGPVHRRQVAAELARGVAQRQRRRGRAAAAARSRRGDRAARAPLLDRDLRLLPGLAAAALPDPQGRPTSTAPGSTTPPRSTCSARTARPGRSPTR